MNQCGAASHVWVASEDDGTTTAFVETGSDGLDLNKVKISSPVARFIRVNAADAIKILVTPAKRHLNQAEQVRRTGGFPESRGLVSLPQKRHNHSL